MIELNDSLIFAEGGRRYCFVHPDDPGKCVKTLSPKGTPEKRRKEAVWYKKLRPLFMFDDNLRELKAFQALGKKGDAVWSHFPRCYGIQPTNRGDGIVTDLIRDADGAVSKTVRQYVKANGKTPELQVALEEFFCLFRSKGIVTRDFLDHNLLVQNNTLPTRTTQNLCESNIPLPKTENLKPNTLKIYMIDGFGLSELIPLSQWVSSLGKRKVDRKIERFIVRYNLAG
jgi:hypothetical protein